MKFISILIKLRINLFKMQLVTEKTGKKRILRAVFRRHFAVDVSNQIKLRCYSRPRRIHCFPLIYVLIRLGRIHRQLEDRCCAIHRTTCKPVYHLITYLMTSVTGNVNGNWIQRMEHLIIVLYNKTKELENSKEFNICERPQLNEPK